MRTDFGTSVRIPVKFVNGKWEFFYGGPLSMKEGAYGEITVNKASILSAKLVELLKQETEHKILNEGDELLVALTIRPGSIRSPSLQKQIIETSEIKDSLSLDYYSFIRSGNTKFVRISIGKPTPTQQFLRPEEAGGAWIRVKGMRPLAVFTSYINVPSPVSKDPLDSLNEAFTRLSECYEPWRKSHTGSIYERVLYKETDGLWYPLDVIRDTALAEDENRMIQYNWAQFLKSIGVKITSSNRKDPK